MNYPLNDTISRQQQCNPGTLKKAKDFVSMVNTSPKISLTLETCAQRIFVCPRRLGQICREILGKSPQQVRAEAIVQEAKRLLLETDYTVSEVSDALDFNEVTNFSKFFRKHTGCTPTEFRGWR